MKFIRKISLFILCISLLSPLSADWAESTLQKMSLDEKIGQLFVVGLYPRSEDALSEGQKEHPTKYVEEVIKKFHVGSILCKFYWDPLKEAHLIQHLQSLSKTPLLVMQDLEWGLNMRLPKALRFPKNMTLGAIQDDGLIYELGKEIARQAKLLGVHCPLAPDVDVNSNPKNPIIGDRSFGDNPACVALKGALLSEGLQKEGVIACAKHFPNHGDTAQDSHTSLPVTTHTLEQIQNIDLVPFQRLIDKNVDMIMTAHIIVPALDPHFPSTLSKRTLQGYLREKMGFQGVIITDDLLMKAISEKFNSQEATVLAFQAGADLLLSSKSIEENFQAIKTAIKNGEITEEEINTHVRRILQLKEKQSKNEGRAESIDFQKKLFSDYAKALKKKLYTNALTLVGENTIRGEELKNAIFVQVGGEMKTPIYTHLKTYVPIPRAYLSASPTQLEIDALLKRVELHDHVIISFQEMSRFSKDNFGIDTEGEHFIRLVEMNNKNVLYVLFGSPYVLQFFPQGKNFLIAYEDDEDAQIAAGDYLLGKIEARGRLPIDIGSLIQVKP